jgi:hypothetical protein
LGCRAARLDEDRVDQRKTDYGDGQTLKYPNFRYAVLLTKVNVICLSTAFDDAIGFWSWKRSLPPTDPQFEWFERHYRCREEEPEGGKRGEVEDAASAKVQGLRRVREFYRKQYEAWNKEKPSGDSGKGKDFAKESPQSFTDRIAALLASEDSGRSRHRR